MADKKNQPAEGNFTVHPNVQEKPIGIVATEWNRNIIDKMLEGARETLKNNGIKEEQLVIRDVPGAYELPLGAKYLMEYAQAQGVICLGCVIKGETNHDRYINEAVATRLAELNLTSNLPAIFGILTTDNEAQALARAGGDKGNKGTEAATALLKMLSLKEELKSRKDRG